MPRSHACPSCLTELARIRAIPDEHYGLPIVVCPWCQLACVRTKHPDQQFWRAFRRTWASIRLVIIKVLLIFLMSLLMSGLVSWSVDAFTDFRGNMHLFEPFVSEYFETMLGAWGIVLGAITIGCLVRLLFLHLRAWAPISMLLMLAAFFSTLDYTVGHFITTMARFGLAPSTSKIPPMSEMILRGQFFAMLAGLAIIGLIPARLLRRFIERSIVKRFRKIRKKLRKRSPCNH